MTHVGSDVRSLFLVLTVVAHSVVRCKYMLIKIYQNRCKKCSSDIYGHWLKSEIKIEIVDIFYLRSVEANVRILPVLMIEVYFN